VLPLTEFRREMLMSGVALNGYSERWLFSRPLQPLFDRPLVLKG
jgi:hypothetical protein